MVCSWGMSEKLGPLKFGTKNDSPFLGKHITESASNFSEDTAREIDNEMREFVVVAQELATKILTERKSVLEAMAQVLIEKETITGEEVEKMLGQPR
jgi:cell division protease FtsH